MNELIFLGHLILILGATVGAFVIDKHLLQALVCVYVVNANLLVIKQMKLAGFIACGGGMYIMGSMCGLLLLQTFWGKRIAQRTLYASFGASILFLLLSLIHVAYLPAPTDFMHDIFSVILDRVPRITLFSMIAHFIAHYVTLYAHHALLVFTRQRCMFSVSVLSMILGQIVDSAIFFGGSFYGHSSWAVIGQMITVSMVIKTLMSVMSSLIILWASRLKGRTYVQ